MKILAFDTSSSACSVAIQNGDKVSALHKNAPMQQGRLLLPMIQELLSASSLRLQDLDAIAYGCGPGSFTGIRIACSAIKSLSFTTQLPILEISSLAILAQTAYATYHCPNWWVALDARMEQVYSAIYKANSAGLMELVGQESVCFPHEVTIPTDLDNQTWSLVGDGWEKYTEQLGKHLQFNPKPSYKAELPNATALLKLAMAKLEKGEWIKSAEAAPAYLR